MASAGPPAERPKDRIAARLRALGYVREDGSVDVPRFAGEHRYDVTMVYHWLRGRVPTKYLGTLAADLETTRGYLLLGEDVGAEASVPPRSRGVLADPTDPPDLSAEIRALDERLKTQTALLTDMRGLIDALYRHLVPATRQSTITQGLKASTKATVPRGRAKPA